MKTLQTLTIISSATIRATAILVAVIVVLIAAEVGVIAVFLLARRWVA